MILYDLCLLIYCLFTLPKFLYEIKKHKDISYRLGLKKYSINTDKKILWIHAVSLGETKSAVLLAKKIKSSMRDKYLLFSSITRTGHEEAIKSKVFDKCIYLPLDFSWIMKPLLNSIKPIAVILIETDFWYNFLRFAKKNRSKIILVNGKISKRSKERYKLIPLFTKKLFSLFDLCSVQTETYKADFQELGAQNLLVITNLKYDNVPTPSSKEELLHWRTTLHLTDETIACVSTHAPEEELILSILEEVWQKKPHLKVLLAPRHPERFSTVEQLLKEKKIPYSKLSKLAKTEKSKVILIDKMGFLSICYQLSNSTIVGGSFVDKIGGHNILEPLFYNKPVYFGPYMFAQKEMEQEVLSHRCGRQVPISELKNLLLHPPTLSSPFPLINKLKGSIKSTLQAIYSIIL